MIINKNKDKLDVSILGKENIEKKREIQTE